MHTTREPDSHATIRIIGGEGASREPSAMYVEAVEGVATDIRMGTRVGVAEGTEHELRGWGALDGPAMALALRWPETGEWVVYNDRSISVAEIERACAAGIEIPTVRI